jgi:hypothetical protein
MGVEVFPGFLSVLRLGAFCEPMGPEKVDHHAADIELIVNY